MGRHGLHAAPRRAGKRAAVRGGLLGVSVAVALGTAAVITTGVVPVGSAFPYVGTETKAEGKTEAGAKAKPDAAGQQQSGLANLSGRASTGPGAGTGSPSAPPSRSASPSKPASSSPSPSAPAPASETPAAPATATPAPAAPTEAPAKPAAPKPVLPKPVQPKPVQPKPVLPKPIPPKPKPTPPQPTPTPTPPPTPTPTPAPSTATPANDDGHSAEEAAVVTLVNQERAQAGCGPVRANPPLATLASAFSKDMAVRGFFDHTDPDGNTPWVRAQNAGIGGLGGENIARGQGDAESVMKAWMNSPGHKANILNCEFRTLGVGAYFADGGPWWTQDFGF
ncbi:CAP domain-containing protein [Streptomyces goshikiensis]|uniref:CAP domain-containing protein n=1 Tax=Streptomyces goshikiensis TaxID=1942 RepID=UPI003697B0F6